MKIYFRPPLVPRVVTGDIQCAIRPTSYWRAGVRADIFAREEKPRLLFRAPVVKVQTLSVGQGELFIEGRPASVVEMDFIFDLAGLPTHVRDFVVTRFVGQVIFWSHADRFFDTRETKQRIDAALARIA